MTFLKQRPLFYLMVPHEEGPLSQLLLARKNPKSERSNEMWKFNLKIWKMSCAFLYDKFCKFQKMSYWWVGLILDNCRILLWNSNNSKKTFGRICLENGYVLGIKPTKMHTLVDILNLKFINWWNEDFYLEEGKILLKKSRSF